MPQAVGASCPGPVERLACRAMQPGLISFCPASNGICLHANRTTPMQNAEGREWRDHALYGVRRESDLRAVAYWGRSPLSQHGRHGPPTWNQASRPEGDLLLVSWRFRGARPRAMGLGPIYMGPGQPQQSARPLPCLGTRPSQEGPLRPAPCLKYPGSG